MYTIVLLTEFLYTQGGSQSLGNILATDFYITKDKGTLKQWGCQGVAS